MSVLRKLQELFPDGKVKGDEWYNINCTECQNHGFKVDTRHLFGINYRRGYTHCFKCKTKYKLTHFLKLANVNYNKDDFVFNEAPLLTTKTTIEFPKEYINTLELFDSRYSNYVKALEYIEKRIGLDLALRINVGFCHIGRYANRIIIPIFDTRDNIVYFVARAIYKFTEPKVLNPIGEKRAILFNWNVAQNFSEIYLAEGVFGALSVFPYGVATLGKEITDSQILVLLRSNVKIINIILDGNAIQDAYGVADKILGLTSKIKIRVLELKKECQPDDLSFEHLLKLRSLTSFYTGNRLI